MFKLACVLLFVLFTCSVFGQSSHKQLRRGDRSYKANEYKKAEEHYRKADALSPSAKGSYNLGNSIYQQGRYKEAITQFETASKALEKTNTQAGAYHNLGNALYQEGDYEAAREAYKQALRRNPDDLATKYNLALVNNQIQEQQQQPQDNSSSEQEQNPEEDPSEEQQPNNQQQQQEGEPQEESQNQQREPQSDLSRDEALQLLQVMDQEEQKVQEKIKRSAKNRPRAKKDW